MHHLTSLSPRFGATLHGLNRVIFDDPRGDGNPYRNTTEEEKAYQNAETLLKQCSLFSEAATPPFRITITPRKMNPDTKSSEADLIRFQIESLAEEKTAAIKVTTTYTEWCTAEGIKKLIQKLELAVQIASKNTWKPIPTNNNTSRFSLKALFTWLLT